MEPTVLTWENALKRCKAAAPWGEDNENEAMNAKEYERALATDPADPMLRQWRNHSIEHRRLAEASERFERQLAAALDVPTQPVDTDALLDRVLRPEQRRSRAPRWLAAAAGVAIAAAASLFALINLDGGSPDDPLLTAFVDHLGHFEPGALGSDDVLEYDRQLALLAEAGLHPDPDVGPLTYASRCIIGGVRGLHLVLTDERGRKSTVLFIPERAPPGSESIELDDSPGYMLASRAGAIAVFAHGGQDPQVLARALLERGDLLAML